MNTIKIGEFLRALRKARGLTQEEVAVKLCLSPKTISRWESGAGIPDINIITAVAELYEVTVDDILRGEKQGIKNSNVTEQTLRLQKENQVKVIQNALMKKYNIFFFSALAVLIVFLLLEIILLFTVSSKVLLPLVPLGIMISFFIMFYFNIEFKNVIKENVDDTLVMAFAKTKDLFRKKYLLYADALALAILFNLILIGIAFSSYEIKHVMYNPFNFTSLQLVIFILLLFGSYLITRRLLVDNSKKVFKLNLVGNIAGVYGVLMLGTLVLINNMSTMTSEKMLDSWILVYLLKRESYIMLIISLVTLGMALASYCFSIIKCKPLFALGGTILGILAMLLISTMSNFAKPEIILYVSFNPLAIISVIISITLAILGYVMLKKAKIN